MSEDLNGKTHDRLEKRIDNLEEKVDLLKDNHVAHLAVDVTGVKTDVKWLKKFFWIVAGSSITGMLAGVGNLLLSS